MRFTLLAVLLIVPHLGYGQFKLKGVVLDSVTELPLYAISVTGQGFGTITDEFGRFEFLSESESVPLTFSFIGMIDRIVIVHANDSVRIYMSYDSTLDEGNHFIKTSAEIGYYGDLGYAPIGGIINWTLQSLGDVDLELNATAKFWKYGSNEGKELAAGIYLPIRSLWFPQYLWGSYSDTHYQEENFFS